MFQEPLLLRGTVAHNAGLGLALRGVGRAERELVLHQLKIAHLADRPERTPAPASPSFPISVDGAIPPEIWLNSLPSEAEELAPQLRGFSYVVVEELVAIVDPRTRKVEIVFRRWGKQ